ncbi:sensor histidine kinase [Trinickia sp. Y13]|uniref:sensor histidine kinase n=1 Tax=Trinickia sp. Y13 TaxID=2917807 RepID=UPI002406E959|nr:sensor histidine kinase [Trinickia sp. Y13]MDG0023937.1 sensor histidine kinase N-terminal domain-containing protein [Trinickia sp. Y13]
MMHSLRARLLWWVLLPLAAFMLVAGVMAYEAARQTADLLQDSVLLASARTIGEDVQWNNGELTANIPPAALEMFESPYQDHVFYKVVAGGDRLLGGSPELSLPSDARASYPVFYDTTLDGQSIRAVAFERQLYNSGEALPVVVIVGKTQASREGMLAQLWHPQLVRQGLMLVLAVLLVLIGLTSELRPLMKLKEDVADRDPMELDPVRVAHLPTELRPIVDAINQCIARLKLHTSTQRQFIADAAHQLRTPLTLLDTQVECARQCIDDTPALSDALAGIHRTSRKMTEITNQLLLLARAEAAPSPNVSVDMTEVVSSVLEELILAAQRRDIDLGAELDGDLRVAGNAQLLTALVANLVDNAVRYTQAGGAVTARCRRQGAQVVLEVEDNGPGIPAEIRAHVFERFYRGMTNVEGTGLGLSIVQRIAQSHGGSVAVAPGAGRIGLVATVRLPAWKEKD